MNSGGKSASVADCHKKGTEVTLRCFCCLVVAVAVSDNLREYVCMYVCKCDVLVCMCLLPTLLCCVAANERKHC